MRVLERIIEVASKEGNTVFDPFMGVGSTGVAALNLGRKFIGIEIDEKYFKAAERRLQSIPRGLFTISENQQPKSSANKQVELCCEDIKAKK